VQLPNPPPSTPEAMDTSASGRPLSSESRVLISSLLGKKEMLPAGSSKEAASS